MTYTLRTYSVCIITLPATYRSSGSSSPCYTLRRISKRLFNDTTVTLLHIHFLKMLSLRIYTPLWLLRSFTVDANHERGKLKHI
jgi:hypothetical protein